MTTSNLDSIIDSIGVTPYHRDEYGVLYCCDCLTILPKIPDKSIDLVLTDPPYGVGLAYDNYADTNDHWISAMTAFIPQSKRLAQMMIMPSCQIKRLEWFYCNFPPDWLLCWYKGSTGCAAYVGFNDWEPHVVYGKINTSMHDYFKATPEPQNNGHPCQKPIAWANWLISRASSDNHLILDPFCGSGTTLVAAKQLGRKYIGIEISEEYCKICVERLRQRELF